MAHGPFDESHVPEQPADPPLPPEIRMQPAGAPRPRPRARPQDPSGRSETWLAFLNNRLILSALSLVVVLLLIAIVLVAIGRGDAGSDPIVTASTPRPNATALPSGDLTARVKNTVSIRNGPSTTYGIVGTVPKGATVPAVGRNDDNTWVQVEYANLTGWIDVQFLQVTGDITVLAVAGPGPTPAVDVPTVEEPPPTAIVIIPTVEEPTSTPTEGTPEPTELPTEEATPTPTEALQDTPTPEATEVPAP
jgi:uncharacterized protein YraI